MSAETGFCSFILDAHDTHSLRSFLPFFLSREIKDAAIVEMRDPFPEKKVLCLGEMRQREKKRNKGK